ISSRVGFLMACTLPQKWPSPCPRSRNQRPPGHGSSFIGNGVPSGVSLCGPSCSSSAVNVESRDARTRISSFTVSSNLSIPGRVRVIFFSFARLIGFRAAIHFCLGALFDAVQLVAPEALEEARPFMHRPDGLGIGAIQHAAAVAAHVDQANL